MPASRSLSLLDILDDDDAPTYKPANKRTRAPGKPATPGKPGAPGKQRAPRLPRAGKRERVARGEARTVVLACKIDAGTSAALDARARKEGTTRSALAAALLAAALAKRGKKVPGA